MGTRSTVKFYSEFNQEPLLGVYQQFDGYISGVGYDLAKFLKDKKVINGFGGETMNDGYANGMGCLAAQYVAANKKTIGGFYVTDYEDLQEYNYEVRLIDGKLIIKVVRKIILMVFNDFEGTPEELLNYKEI